MSINENEHVVATKQNTLLHLSITEKIELIELTIQIARLCEQAEDNHAILILKFNACSFNVMNFSNNIRIQDVNRWEQALRRVERLNNTVIAVVSGTISGPALDLFLTTDYRIATSDFRFLMPINENQIWPGMFIHRLVNQIGVARSRQLLLNPYKMTTDLALNLGLIDEVSDTIHETLNTAISRFNGISGTELAIRRRLMLEATTTTFEDSLGIHLAACDRELRRLYHWKLDDPRDYNQ